jgi:hypothetical protein
VFKDFGELKNFLLLKYGIEQIALASASD